MNSPMLEAESPSSERPSNEPPFVFISYRSQDPDRSLAHQFSEGLRQTGCQTFMAAENLRIGDDWPARIDEALERCDFFLLLLSDQSASSDMVIQEIRKAKTFREMRFDKRPRIMPVRVNLPFERTLNYEIDAYLGRMQQLLWEDASKTSLILDQILRVIAAREFDPPEINGKRDRNVQTELSPNQTPLPVAEPEWPAGHVPHDSAFYLERPFVDQECFAHILKPKALLRIRAPRQMGKTSLLARILNHGGQNGCAVGQISFQLIGDKTLSDMERFLVYFCRRVGKCMGLPNKLDEFWDEDNDSVDNCNTYFTEYLLRRLNKPFILGLDEVDELFQYREVARHFLKMLRGFMDSGDVALWGNLRVVLVHSTECYIAMPVNSSPFNIGKPVQLRPFTEEQVSELARRHGLSLGTETRRFRDAVNGHPFLIRLALYLVAQKEKNLSQILEEAPTEAGPFSDHLRRHYYNLSQHPELLEAIKTVVATQAQAEKCKAGSIAQVELDSMSAFKLEGMGLVKAVGNDVSISCDVYQKYFQDRFHIKP